MTLDRSSDLVCIDGGSVYSEQQRKFGDTRQQMGVRGPAERRDAYR